MKEREASIVGQYTKVVGQLDEMFREIDTRSNSSLWRLTGGYGYNGVGSCKNVTKRRSEEELEGEAKDVLIKLRDARNQAKPGTSSLSSCPYHREDYGCVLAELKSPRCISHVDNPAELAKRFGIDGDQLTDDIHWILSHILKVRNSETGGSLDTPTKNDGFVESASEAISQMTNHVRKFPILHSAKMT